MYVCVCMCAYVCLWRERESERVHERVREREREKERKKESDNKVNSFTSEVFWVQAHLKIEYVKLRIVKKFTFIYF